MEKIKRLILGYLPNQKCNLKCGYCYISQLQQWDNPQEALYSPEYIAKCLSAERLGGTCLINLTAQGETLLVPGVPQLVEALLREGHFVEVVTNGTVTKRVHEFLSLPDELTKRLFFKLSFHYRELKRLGLLETFFANVRAIRASAASLTLELMPCDDLEGEIDEIEALCVREAGAVCQATVGRNDRRKGKPLLSAHSAREFREIWNALNSDMFRFKMDMLGVKRREFCYAGAWSLSVNLYNGEAMPCYWQPNAQNIFENPEKPIAFRPVGNFCTLPWCLNAHAHLTWGLIPELETPPYCAMRNRVCADGGEWLKPECRAFFSSRLSESNPLFTPGQKALFNATYPFYLLRGFCRNWRESVRRLGGYLRRK